jgi:hypothetical protein
MDALTRGKLEVILRDAEMLAGDIRSVLEEPPGNELTAQEMVRTLLASTGGKRYGWADKFGVDEVTIRKWAAGTRQPSAAHLETLKKLYEDTKK